MHSIMLAKGKALFGLAIFSPVIRNPVILILKENFRLLRETYDKFYYQTITTHCTIL